MSASAKIATTSRTVKEPKKGVLARLLSRLWDRSPRSAPRRANLEPLESRLLLSADIATAGLAAALDAGLDAFGDRVQDFIDAEPLLNTPLPIVVTAGLNSDDEQILLAATVKDLLAVPVDADQDGIPDLTALDDLDDDAPGTPGAGVVDFAEFFRGKFVSKLTDPADGLAAYAGAHPGNTLADYFNQSIFDATIGPLTLNVTAVDTSDTHQVSGDLDISLSFVNLSPIDLGFGADELGFRFGDDVDLEVTASLDFALELGVFTSGEDASAEDFFIDTGSVTALVSAEVDPFSADAQVGFLGVSISGGVIDLTAQAQAMLQDPFTAAGLGFTTAASGTQSITGNVAPPSEDLSATAQFLLRIGSGDMREVSVAASDNADLAGLIADVQAAVDTAGFAGIVTADDDGGKIRLSLPAGLDVGALDFGNEVEVAAGGELKTASAVVTDDASVAALTGLSKFLVVVDHDVPVLLSLDFNSITTVAGLLGAINTAINPKGAEAVQGVGPDAGKLIIRSSGTAKALQITRTVTLDSKITTSDLQDATDVFAAAVADAGSGVTVTLPIAVSGGSDLGFTPAGVSLSFSSTDPFNPGTLETDADGNERFDLTLTSANFSELLNFNNLNASTFVSLLNQLADWLDQFRQSELVSSIDVPLTGADLGDLLDFSEMLQQSLLVNKLLDVNNAPTFGTVQELATQLDTILPMTLSEIAATYDPLTDELSYQIEFDHTLSALDIPLDFSVDLAPLLDVSSNSTVSITADGSFAFKVGVFLGDAPASELLTGTTPLSDFFPLEEIKTDPAVTGPSDVRTIYGRLVGDGDATNEEVDNAHFRIRFDGGAWHDVAVTKTSTDDNLTLADLATDFNTAFTTAGINSDISASVDGSRIKFTVTDALIDTVEIDVTSSTDSATRELGLVDDIVERDEDGVLAFSMRKDAPRLVGQLTADQTFQLAVDGGAAVEVVVDKDKTTANKSILDLVNDVQLAVNEAGLNGQIEVKSLGNRLVFTGLDSIATFTVTASAGNQLGLPTGTTTSNSADLEIVLPDNSSFLVTLDGATTLQHVINAIETAVGNDNVTIDAYTGPEVEADISADGTALVLTAHSTGTHGFKVLPINGSWVAYLLGIAGETDEETAPGSDAFRLVGTTLGGLTPAERFFVEDAHIEGNVSLTTPGGIALDAQFGFVGVNATGNGTFGASLATDLTDPGTGTPGGRVTLDELFTALSDNDEDDESDIGDVVAAPTISEPAMATNFGQFTLSLSLDPSFTAPGFTLGSPQVTITVAELDDITVTTTGTSDLYAFDDIDFDDILQGLQHLADFLDDFEAFGFLSEPLPVVNFSFNELLSFAGRFSDAVDDAQSNPAATLQLLEAKLEEALGLAPGSPALTLSLDKTGGTFLKLDLSLGASFDRPLGVDFELPGMPLNLGGSAGLNASGSLTLDLDLGFDLDNPTQVFLYDTSGLTGVLDIVGNDLSFRAAVGPAGLFIDNGTVTVGDGTANGDALGANLFVVDVGGTGFVDGRKLITSVSLADNFTATVDGAVHVALPVYFPSDSIFAGTVAFDATITYDSSDDSFNFTGTPSATDENGAAIDFDDLFAIDPSQLGLLDGLLLGVDGIDLFLGGLQDALDGEIGGFELPLIGDKLSRAATFIEDFRDGFIDDFRDAVEMLASPAVPTSGPDPISLLLFNLLGPSGLDILLELDPDADADDLAEIEDIIFTTNINDPGVDPAAVFVDWDMRLGQHIEDLGASIDFDLGIPALGLETDGEITVEIDWELAFGFGLNFDDGFYLDIADGSELEVDVVVSTPGLAITGRLGFLQVSGTEDDDVDMNPSTPEAYIGDTHLGASFTVNLVNALNASDQKLGFSELGRLGVEADFSAEAAVDLALELSLNSDLVPGADTVFPKLVADFTLRWEFDSSTDGAFGGSFLDADDGLKFVGFEDIGLDLGSFLTDTIKPIVEQVQEVTEPLQPIIDVLTTPIPVISDLAGPITLLDIAEATGFVNPAMIAAIETVAQIVDLVNGLVIPSEGNVILPYGDFTLYEAPSSPGIDFSNPNFDLSGVPLPAGFSDILTALGPIADEVENALKKMLPDASGSLSTGLRFPIFEHPEQIFGLLLGQNATLVQYDMAPLEFEFKYKQFFPIIGPLGVSITGEASAFIDFLFGYDTEGLVHFAESGFRNPELLFDGFFIGDRTPPEAGGEDVDEMVFTAGISAAAELNIAVASAGVSGGIFAEIYFDLHDPNDDGRVRIDEIVNNFMGEVLAGDPALAPLAIFDVSGTVFAKLFAFLEVDLLLFSIDFEEDITPEITLLDFDIEFARVPVLATELSGGALQLNMGQFADQRLEGDTSDGNENFVVTQADSEHVWVWSPLVDFNHNGLNDGNEAQKYKVTSSIIALGGEGDDTIDLSGVSNASVVYDIEGGAGNDIIKAGAGAARILGGTGDDQLWGGGSADTIFGERGNDTIHGGGGNDRLFGDGDAEESILGNTITVEVKTSDGVDTIYGDDGEDILFGAGGGDTLEGGANADLVIGDGAIITLSGDISSYAVRDTTRGAGGNDILRGDGGNDRVYGGKGNDQLHGGDNDDKLYGEVGFDTINGNAGADLIYGGSENDVINGGSGGDTIYGEGGNDVIHGDGNDDWIDGGTGADTLYGDGGADKLYGRSDPDAMYGGGGNDYLEGGQGNDVMFGGDGVAGSHNGVPGADDGQDTLVGGYGSDTLDGEANSDEYLITARGGNTTELTTAYDSGAVDDGFDRMVVNGTSASDTFLLRAMADAYLPSWLELGTALSEAFFFGADDPLEAMTFAIQRAYGPNPVPAGMIPALETAYAADPGNLFVLAFAVFFQMEADLTDTAFVALLNNGGANVERFNYREMDRVVVNGLLGDDYMVIDDNLGEVVLNGGPDNDRFQVGQVFRSARGDDPTTEEEDERLAAHIAPDDVFETIKITRGWLSNGITFPMTINGGTGNDEFTVFHNLAVLTLNGGDDDDIFTVRSFALEGSADSGRARTDMKGDSGADTILYAYNAPVGIDGGDGFDTIKVIGTEFSDDYVVTFDGIFGAGRYITYVNVEQLTVDGAEGDDRFFILSTNENVVTEIQGGLGSDTFFVAGTPTNEPIPVLADDLRGHSGIILNSVEVSGTNYDGTKIEGLSANVADNDEAYLVLHQTGGVSVVTEGAGSVGDSPAESWGFDRYYLVLTRQPEDDVLVQIGVPEVPPEEQARGYSTLKFWLDDGDGVVEGAELADSRQLTFTSSTWWIPQEVRFVASDDAGLEGTQFAVINHQVKSAGDPGYDALAIPSVKVQINDDDRDGVIITPTGNSTLVFEDPLVPIYQDTYSVVLTHAPTSNVVVHLDPVNDQVTLSATELTFTPGDWNVPKTVTITAINDVLREGFHTEYIRHTVESDDAATTDSVIDAVVDGDLDLAGAQPTIPPDKPVDMLLLPHKPLLGEGDPAVTVKLDGATLDRLGSAGADSDTRWDIFGNTLAFYDAAGNSKRISGAVTASYSYAVPGYDDVAVDRVVAEVADNDAPGVVIIESEGSTDVIEGGLFFASDSFQVVLTMAPSADVTVNATPMETRTTRVVEQPIECDPNDSIAWFRQQVNVSSSTLTFTTDNWFNPQTVLVSAIDDDDGDGITTDDEDDIDGNLTQVFAPTLYTVNDIRGPLFLEGAAGEGSIHLPEPLVLPGELNERQADGDVLAFTGGTGVGATETMTVDTAELLAALQDECEDGDETFAEDLIGLTLQIATGPGLDRFWQITGYAPGTLAGTTLLTLKNPTQIDAGAVNAPTADSTWTLNALSANFFVNEEEQIDFTMIFDQDSVADDVGSMSQYDAAGADETGTFGAAFAGKGHISGLGMGPNTTIGEVFLPGGITHDDMEVVRLDLGLGDDTLTVNATTRREDFYTLTIVNTGAGDDEVTVDLHPETDGAFSLDTQGGNDKVFADDSTLPLVIFGGEGNDEIHGGDGADIIFGDRGRVDYVNGLGEIVTRLGTSIPFIAADDVTSATATTLTDSDASFPLTYDGLKGLVVSLIPDDENIAIQFRTIVSNTANTLTVSQAWDVIPDATFSYRISFFPEDQTDTQVRGPRVVWSIDDAVGGTDTIWGEGGADTLIGGAQGDVIRAGEGDDFVAGDNVRLDYVPISGSDGPTKLNLIATPMARHIGGADGIEGNDGNDVIMGGTGSDGLDGGAGFDLLFGDNAILVPRFDTLTPLVRVLAGSTLFDGGGYADPAVDDQANVTTAMQANQAGAQMYDITLLDHAAGVSAALYGSDTMAGGADDDMMFGQLGDDVMLGDASVNPETRMAAMGQELETDGDDYIEGNGATDTIYGNLGQDDILGGSSDFFGLATPALRLDGDDLLFGGAGTDTARNFADDVHARDADVILGDNGQIFRIVDGLTGEYRTYNYDVAYAEPIRIIPRSWNLLDYTPGTGSPSDIAGIDRIYGESGNDIIHGMGGSDILFGDAGDDDLYGGAGNDWMSGGDGVDGMLGDDGRIFTSRNGLTEPLNGILIAVQEEELATSGNLLTATINVEGELTKYVDLEPWDQGGDDIMYGGLGDDFMHGGAGIDGMSGAEALEDFYADAQSGFTSNAKPVLVFNEATGRFELFDNTQPLQKIDNFFLNFEATSGGATVHDGNDRLFGDLGHDWLVGGTDSDHLYGGYGNDVLNADDNLDTNGGVNDAADSGDLAGGDIAYGGAGTDQLIGNSLDDRLVDWAGEFNAFWVPFSPFGSHGAVNRNLLPGFPEFLYALSKADGADQTRTGTGFGTAERNGEPYGELGLVLQHDADWQAQIGGPTDPQPGNNGGQK